MREHNPGAAVAPEQGRRGFKHDWPDRSTGHQLFPAPPCLLIHRFGKRFEGLANVLLGMRE